MAEVRMYEDDRERQRHCASNSIPTDRCYFVYCVFFLLGVGSLLPWSFFGNARQYFLLKLRNVNISGPESYTNASLFTSAQVRFQSNLEIASQTPNVLFVFINMILTRTVSARLRIVLSICLNIVLFIPTIWFTRVDSDDWQHSFLIVLFTTVVLMNAGSAVLQGAISGLASMFPRPYIQSVYSGMGFSGVVASLCSVLTVALGPDARDSAFAFFLIAELFLIGCLVLYLIAFSTMFGKFYAESGSRNVTVTLTAIHSVENSDSIFTISKSSIAAICNSCRTIAKVARNIWIAALSVFFVYLISLTCIPVQATIQSTSSDEVWADKYFTPVIFFLVASLADFFGRNLAGIIQRPRDAHPVFFVVCLFRGLFLPLFLFCNVQPRPHGTYVAFQSDAVPAVLNALFGLSNGYLGTLSMMHAPRLVPEEDFEMAGSMMACFLSIGLAMGAALSSSLVDVM